MSVSDRIAVKGRIVDVADAAEGLELVQVCYQHPGQDARSESIWLGSVTGDMENVDMGGVRSGKNDSYSIEAVVAVTGKDTEREADERCQEIVQAFIEAIFSGPKLGLGFKQAIINPGKVDGPNSFRVSPSAPASSVTEITINVLYPQRGARP